MNKIQKNTTKTEAINKLFKLQQCVIFKAQSHTNEYWRYCHTLKSLVHIIGEMSIE